MFTLLQIEALEDTVTGLGHAWEKLGIVGVMGLVILGLAFMLRVVVKRYFALLDRTEETYRRRNQADRESRYVAPPTRPPPPDVAADPKPDDA
jgi:hypothetical protein